MCLCAYMCVCVCVLETEYDKNVKAYDKEKFEHPPKTKIHFDLISSITSSIKRKEKQKKEKKNKNILTITCARRHSQILSINELEFG